MDVATLIMAGLATVISACFFVGSKVVMARFAMPWSGVWTWTLLTSGICGLVAWLANGAQAVSWSWCLAAGLAGALAHICANLALSWGEATMLVPLSGAKPLFLLVLNPLFSGAALPGSLVGACWMATFGIALTGLAPRRVHRHASKPGVAFLLMAIAVVLMALSDLCGRHGVALTEASGGSRTAGIAVWNIGLGILPLAWLLARRPAAPRAGVLASMILGVLFAVFIALLAMAFALAPDPRNAVASVNVVVACRGMVAVLLVLGLDHWMRMGLEPIPRWIHGLRLIGAAILALSVFLAAMSD
jgi:hypothetical protein